MCRLFARGSSFPRRRESVTKLPRQMGSRLRGNDGISRHADSRLCGNEDEPHKRMTSPTRTDDCNVADRQRFLADAMLGKLARWLRVLGADTLYNPAEDDRDLVRIADAEQRVLLTRDRHLVEHLRPERSLLLDTGTPLDQLRQVIGDLELTPPAGLFTRCMNCNRLLCNLPEEEARLHVPEESRAWSGSAPGSASAPGPVRQCPECRRVYWPGSHTRRMRQLLQDALPEWL